MKPGVDEIAQDVVGPRPGRGQIDQGRIFRRRLEQAGEHRRFRKIDVARGFPEIGLGGRLNAERARAHVRPVEIELENLLLRQMVLEPKGEIGLLDLALDRPFIGEEQVLRQLLGDRRTALDDAGGLCVDGQRADGADHVDAEVTEEAPVLGRQHRLDEIVRQLVERHGVVVLDAALADLDAVAVLKGHREVAALQPIVVGCLPERRDGQGQHDEEAGEPDRQRFAGKLDQNTGSAGEMEPVGRGVHRRAGR